MKTQTVLAVITALTTLNVSARTIETVEGAALYLNRAGFETHRAEFNHQADCELIAKAMRKAEPNVSWYCSTSTNPRKFKCSLDNVSFDNTLHSYNFELSLNRGKARIPYTHKVPAVISSFDYNEYKPFIVMYNDYKYIEGNFISSAVTHLKLNPNTGELIPLDINGNRNGTGHCTE